MLTPHHLATLDRLAALGEIASRTRVLLLATDASQGDDVRPCDACFGVDLTVVAGAPGDELLRIDVSTDRGAPHAALLGLEALRLGLPIVEAGGEVLAIDHDFPDAFVIRAVVPRQADDQALAAINAGHVAFLSWLGASTTIAEGSAVSSRAPGGRA